MHADVIYVFQHSMHLDQFTHALIVLYDIYLSILEDADTGVGGSKVNANDWTFLVLLVFES